MIPIESSVSPVSSVVERRSQQHDRRNGFTLIELLIVITVIAVIAAIVLVAYTRIRINAAEAAAIHSLRTIHSAQDAFRATCGHGSDYATSLPQLGAANVISPDLAGGAVVTKTQYLITMTAIAPGQADDTCTKEKTAGHWYASAVPMPGAPTGLQGFATTDQDDIWRDSTGVAPKPPFASSPTVSRIQPF